MKFQSECLITRRIARQESNLVWAPTSVWDKVAMTIMDLNKALSGGRFIILQLKILYCKSNDEKHNRDGPNLENLRFFADVNGAGRK